MAADGLCFLRGTATGRHHGVFDVRQELDLVRKDPRWYLEADPEMEDRPKKTVLLNGLLGCFLVLPI